MSAQPTVKWRVSDPDPSVSLRQSLSDETWLDPVAAWRPLAGGRSNRIWKIGRGVGALVCKLYTESGASPLFPNDADAEALSLSMLSGTGLAPEFVALRDTPLGRCLVYRYVDGTPLTRCTVEVGNLLSQLHRQPPPPGLRRIGQGPDALRAQGSAILHDCLSPPARALRDLCPQGFDLPPERLVWLHGDVVPANLVRGPAGLTLIDWQCPALGDPTEDLALALSPAMQALYGKGPLSAADRQALLAAYGNPAVALRLARLQPLYHWRMAAHCLWKVERGASDYAAAMQLELQALKDLQDRDGGG